MSKRNYPPQEIINPPTIEKKNYEHIILWMLYNNQECEWSDFLQKPLEIPTSTLSRHLKLLNNEGYITKISKGHYKITIEGKRRFFDLSKVKEKKRKLSFPPETILKDRNYDHWILWMVYNNTYCKWSDFLEEPLYINQSSLSKTIRLLIKNGLVRKDEDNKEYRITPSGKSEYSRMLKSYDLDKQTILEEESRRIEDITQKTLRFFDNYGIDNKTIQFRFLNYVLNLDYERVKSMLIDEEDFQKILLFLSINHPNQYPDYISSEQFSETYGIKKTTLEYYIEEIVQNDIYSIKFFELSMAPDKHYYFQSNEKLEMMLRAITEEYIKNYIYMEKLFSKTTIRTQSLTMSQIVDDIVEEICEFLFHKDLKNSLKDLLSEYINYLAYKIEAKRELKESYDKLEGIIWQDVSAIFQSKSLENFEGQFEQEIKKINKEINLNPEKIDLYYSKIRILMYFDQFDEVLNLLDNMFEIFPESEKNIKIKKAYVLKGMQEVEAGLDIINKLLQKYPKDNDILNYKAYWLQYLDKKEEALELIQDLVVRIPDNGTYLDTYGEILMYFEEYEKAIKQFLKVLELASTDWYINQTYIKLGICYRELKKYDLAVEYLKKGKELTNKSLSDPESKQKWRVIADLFLAETDQLNAKF